MPTCPDFLLKGMKVIAWGINQRPWLINTLLHFSCNDVAAFLGAHRCHWVMYPTYSPALLIIIGQHWTTITRFYSRHTSFILTSFFLQIYLKQVILQMFLSSFSISLWMSYNSSADWVAKNKCVSGVASHPRLSKYQISWVWHIYTEKGAAPLMAL